MSLSELSAADVAAVTGNNRGGDFGGFGNNSDWLVVLFLFAMFGGWGGNRGGNYGGGYGGGYDIYPWLNNSNQINSISVDTDRFGRMKKQEKENLGHLRRWWMRFLLFSL